MNSTERSLKSQGGLATRSGKAAMASGTWSGQYGMSVIPREDFEEFHTFVQAVFDEGRQRFSPVLASISQDTRFAPECHIPHLASCDSLGVTMEDFGKSKQEFHIWMNPAYKLPTFRFYMTLAHELTHGYAGLQYGHAPHWRRWYYRVLCHLIEAKMMPVPESDIEMILYAVEARYNHSVGDLFALPVEARNKAKEEHQKVLENYWSRIA